jgi:ribosome-associated toxin RatA of RatAB toxin-antitoxin module
MLMAICAVRGEPGIPVPGDWDTVSQGKETSIYSRVHPGGTLKEYKAVGTVGALPRVVQAVLEDIENYSHFMPFMIQCRVLKRDDDSLVSYQRISPPFCTDRDYTIRVWRETRPGAGAGAGVFVCRWEQANALGPPEQGNVMRVKIDEGSWTVEAAPGNVARVTYFLYTDSGGSLPGWLAAKANEVAINKLFDAIRKQAKDPKYAGAQ